MVAFDRELKISGSKDHFPYTSALALGLCGFDLSALQLKDGQQVELNLDGVRIQSDFVIARLISQSSNDKTILGTNISEKAQIEEILSLSEHVVAGYLNVTEILSQIEFSKSGTLFENKLTVGDLALWTLIANDKDLQTKYSALFNVVLQDARLAGAHNLLGKFQVATPKTNVADKKDKQKDEGKFVELPGAEKGKVVVRFPPEASGYLHIGHAKAALLNQFYQQEFEGRLIFRFDDTNPAKENSHFEQIIIEDLEILNIKPDTWSHSSDHFDVMLEMCERLIKEGKAFVDDTDTETMRNEREQRQDSKNRTNSVEKNMQLWEEMKKGTEIGQKCCARIKIDMKSNNGAMRDPTIYRCKPEEHVRTGMKYKVYPTYDFTCPIVDSIEGVTHTLRTTEYHDRDDQFYFICDALGLRKPHIWEYARLNMTNTVMSKRKLTWFVEEGLVEGWDDPRLPTVRGVMRRGMTVEGLKQFIAAQGGSRSIVMMEWDKIWSFNKKVIDPIAPRYTALDSSNLVTVVLDGNVSETLTDVSLHPKDASIGSKKIWQSSKLFLEQVDAAAIKKGDTVTFVNWGNVKINDVVKKGDLVTEIRASLDLQNTDFKKTLKVTWIGQPAKESSSIPVVGVVYDHIISKAVIGKDEDWKQYINKDSMHHTKMIGEPALKNLKKGDIIQIQRKGFYICDHPYQAKSPFSGVETPLVLIYIPDGHVKENPALAKKENKPAVSTAAGSTGDHLELYNKVTKQGELVRDLKAKDPKADAVKSAVASLLELKKQYMEKTGNEYKPGQPPAAPAAASAPAGGASSLYDDITKQGELVRDLKAKDPKGAPAKEAISKLLELKKKFKEETGAEYKPGQAPAAAPAPAPAPTAGGASSLYDEITKQGELVRDLKAKDPKGAPAKEAIAKLLELKKKFKEETGAEYKPGQAPAAPAPAAPAPSAGGASSLYDEITKQGELVRDLKAKDPKGEPAKAAIAKLLELKKTYKEQTGAEYKPGQAPAAPAAAAAAPSTGGASSLYDDITKQGELVRELKGKDPKGAPAKEAIAKLLELKKTYKEQTGQEYKPGQAPAASQAAPAVNNDGSELYNQITAQGDLVRQVKSKDAKSDETKAAIAKLLELKTQYKAKTGKDYKPGEAPQAPAANGGANSGDAIAADIVKQGTLVRELKSKDAKSKETTDAIAKLLALKKSYKETTGKDYKP